MSMFSFAGAGLVCSRWLSSDICSARAASISAFFPDACCWSQTTTPNTIRNAATNPTIIACFFSHERFMSHGERFCAQGECKGLALRHRVWRHVDHDAGLIIEICRFAQALSEIVDQLNVALGIFHGMNPRAFNVEFADGLARTGGWSAGWGGFRLGFFSPRALAHATATRGAGCGCRATRSGFCLWG